LACHAFLSSLPLVAKRMMLVGVWRDVLRDWDGPVFVDGFLVALTSYG